MCWTAFAFEKSSFWFYKITFGSYLELENDAWNVSKEKKSFRMMVYLI